MVALTDAIRSKVGECLKNKAKAVSEQERNQLLSELTESSDSRYRVSVDAVNRALMYMTWMVEAGSTLLPTEEHGKYSTFFELKRHTAEQKAVEASEAEKAIAVVINSGTFNEQNHHSLIKNYFHTKNGQITLHKQILEKESELGNLFIFFVQEYLRRHFRQIQEKTPNSALTIAKALKIIQRDSLEIKDILQLNYQAMLHSVDQLQNHLNSRQDKLGIMQKVILHLNTVIDVMTEEENTPDVQSRPSNRMAFSSKS